MPMNDEITRIDAELDAFFEAERAAPLEASPAFMARVLGDAMEVADGFEAAPVAAPAPKKRGLFGFGLPGALALLGGWPAAASMATATIAGVWIGAAQPAGLASVSGGWLGAVSETASLEYDLDDFVPGYGAMAELDTEVAE